MLNLNESNIKEESVNVFSGIFQAYIIGLDGGTFSKTHQNEQS